LPPFFAAFDANIISPWLIAHFARIDLRSALQFSNRQAWP
jgi:hypothetical protein